MLRILSLIGLVFCVSSCTIATEKKHIYGYIEKVIVHKTLCLPAKLDSGAKSASLYATNIKEVNVNGKTFLRFDVPIKNKKPVEMQALYLGKTRIKMRAGEHNKSHVIRPMVLLSIQLDGKRKMIPVNLANRKHFIYPLLLGRNALVAFNAIVDPSRAFLAKPCHKEDKTL